MVQWAPAAAQTVAAMIVHPVSALAQVGLSDGSTVTVTADHPFYVGVARVLVHNSACDSWANNGALSPQSTGL